MIYYFYSRRNIFNVLKFNVLFGSIVCEIVVEFPYDVGQKKQR